MYKVDTYPTTAMPYILYHLLDLHTIRMTKSDYRFNNNLHSLDPASGSSMIGKLVSTSSIRFKSSISSLQVSNKPSKQASSLFRESSKERKLNGERRGLHEHLRSTGPSIRRSPWKLTQTWNTHPSTEEVSVEEHAVYVGSKKV